ncbi:MAG TPA: CBS domain-containing protein [Gemmatimonadales bacterium]|nr:CBS domain-containing protein [Gemmatimonadales bacterium]
MRLQDVVELQHVVVPLTAQTVREATERLAERLIASGVVSEANRLNAVIRNAWPEDMVSVGEHAFLPHFRTEAARRLATAVGVSLTPIRWEKDVNRSARIVILIVAPPRETPTYLQVVGAFARLLSDPTTVLAVLAAKTPEQLIQIGALQGVELPTHLTVRDLMTPHVLSARPEQSLGDVARMMMEKDVRALPVVGDNGSLVGMVTHRELLKYLIPDYLQKTKSGKFRAMPASMAAGHQSSGGGDPRALPVRDVMSRAVLCVSEEQTLSDVANLMNNKDVDRFPVVREGVVVGFLTRADLIRRLVANP